MMSETLPRSVPRLAGVGLGLLLGLLLGLPGCALFQPAPKEKVIDPLTQSEFAKGLELMRGGYYEQAAQVFEAITARDASVAGPFVNLGIAYRRLGRAEDARKALEQALAINPNRPEAYNQLGILHREAGRFREAEETYTQGLGIAPDDAGLHLNYGVLCDIYLQRLDCALEQYQRYQALAGAEDKEVKIWIADVQQRVNVAQSLGEAKP